MSQTEKTCPKETSNSPPAPKTELMSQFPKAVTAEHIKRKRDIWENTSKSQALPARVLNPDSKWSRVFKLRSAVRFGQH